MKKKLLYIIPVIILLGFVAWHVSGSHQAEATGDASFALTPSTGSYTVGSVLTIQISETSSAGDNTNAVQIYLSYPSTLSFQSTTPNGPFTLCAQNTHTATTVSLACASTTAVSGAQNVASISFSVTGAGSSQPVALTSGSDIDNTGGQSVWNGALPAAYFTFSSTSGGSTPTPTPAPKPAASKAPAATPTPTPTPALTPTPTPSASPVAQLGSVSFTISDAKGRVQDATVTLDGRSDQTNASGIVNFSGVSSGRHTVKVTAPGDQPLTATINLSPGQNDLVTYKLTSVPSFPWVPLLVALLVVLAVSVGGWSLRRFFKPAPAPATNLPSSMPTLAQSPAATPPAQLPPSPPSGPSTMDIAPKSYQPGPNLNPPDQPRP